MEFLTGSTGEMVHEHLYSEKGQRIGHRTLPAGFTTGEGKLHPAPAHGVIIPVKGRLQFNTTGHSEEIQPGCAVVMEKGEPHSMTALTDCEIMVVLDLLR